MTLFRRRAEDLVVEGLSRNLWAGGAAGGLGFDPATGVFLLSVCFSCPFSLRKAGVALKFTEGRGGAGGLGLNPNPKFLADTIVETTQVTQQRGGSQADNRTDGT